MKKVLLLTENFPPIEGGSGRWFWELYSRLPKNNVVVCTHNIEGGNEFDSTHDIPIIRMPLHSKEWGVKSFKGLIFYWQTIKRLKRLIRDRNIEEVHCGRVIHEGVSGWVLKLLTGIPFRCFVHGEDVETAATSREHSFLVRQVCKHATSLICNSFNSKKLLKALEFAEGEKCFVLHPGVDIEKFKPAPRNGAFRQRVGWPLESLVLLTVGRLQRRKGQDYLIQAMPALLKVLPSLHYAVVGRGEEENRLRALIRSLDLTEHVSLHTDFNDDDLVSAYQQCDIFILPNRTIKNDLEGFGMVLVEAQACGKPVIAGDSGGTSETLDEDATGVILDCSTPSTISKQLPETIKRCREFSSAKIIEHAQTRFNWEAHTALFLAKLESHSNDLKNGNNSI